MVRLSCDDVDDDRLLMMMGGCVVQLIEKHRRGINTTLCFFCPKNSNQPTVNPGCVDRSCNSLEVTNIND